MDLLLPGFLSSVVMSVILGPRVLFTLRAVLLLKAVSGLKAA